MFKKSLIGISLLLNIALSAKFVRNYIEERNASAQRKERDSLAKEKILNHNFSDHYTSKQSHFESLPPESDEIIFLGNSIIESCQWSELFQNNKIKNRGIGGDVSIGVLNRIRTITESHPRKVFLMIGVNDLAYNFTVNEIVKNIAAIVDSIITKSPSTEIYIYSILPVDELKQPHRSNFKITTINKQLVGLCNSKSVTFIDLYPLFLNDNGQLKSELSRDGLHPNGKGYLIIKDASIQYVIG